MYVDGLGPQGARLERLSTNLQRAVAAVEVDEVGGGDSGDDAGKVVLERRGQRRRVPPEGEPVDADVRLGLVEPDPPDRRADVPRRLSETVHGVDEVDGHEPLAAVS